MSSELFSYLKITKHTVRCSINIESGRSCNQEFFRSIGCAMNTWLKYLQRLVFWVFIFYPFINQNRLNQWNAENVFIFWLWNRKYSFQTAINQNKMTIQQLSNGAVFFNFTPFFYSLIVTRQIIYLQSRHKEANEEAVCGFRAFTTGRYTNLWWAFCNKMNCQNICKL